MKAVLRALAICTVASASACLAQDSLGDLARQRRFSKPAQQPQHEITNDEIATSSATSGTNLSQPADVKNPDANSKNESPNAAEVQAKIRAQKEKVDALAAKIVDDQKKLDEMTCPKGTTCGQRVLLMGTGPSACDVSDALSWHPYAQWCDQPDKLQADIDATQQQLDSERAILESMQEEARQQGFGNAIYDPD